MAEGNQMEEASCAAQPGTPWGRAGLVSKDRKEGSRSLVLALFLAWETDRILFRDNYRQLRASSGNC